MHRRNVSTRRRFLRLAGSTAAISVLPAMISVRPAEATPEMMATAIRTVTGGAPVQTGKVKLDIPPLVENGNTVPMTVSVTSPMTEQDYVKSIHVFNEKNPQPNIGNFIPAPGPAARRFRPASALPTAKRWLRSPASPTTASGRSAPMSS
jgi:sulfur-oxidizing protein SoxY